MEKFKEICTNLGEKLRQEEILELLEDMDLDENGILEYEDFIKMLLAR